MAATYDDDERFRSGIIMGRHGFGRGEYKYFAHPLPDQLLRVAGAKKSSNCAQQSQEPIAT
jgi:hypothetical protein